jgi:glucosyl-dolichyl phosphate glucuronosyltransferase
MAAFHPRISTVICTYERYASLRSSIESLLSQEIARDDIEIIVVDNSPEKQKSIDFAGEYGNSSPIKFIFEPRPGLSNARNVGLQAARADIVAFIDDDALAAPGWAQAIVDAYVSFKGQAGIVGGRVALRWPDKQPGWLGNNLLGYLGQCDLGKSQREIDDTEWLVGCNISYDRGALLKAGGFQVELGRNGGAHNLLSNEELEASKRIKALGKKIIYAPAAFAEHVVDPDRVSQRWFRRRSAWQAVSDYVSRPHDVAQMVRLSTRRIGRLSKLRSKSESIGFFSEKTTSLAFKQDVDMVYNLVILLLAGGAFGMDSKNEKPTFFDRVLNTLKI